jgi:uncharacterized GH25 family protein
VKRLLCVITIALALLLAFPGILFAHAVFFEIDNPIIAGRETEIRIIWGHFPDTPDAGSAYFTELPEGTLIVIGPDGTERPLTMLARDDYYFARFNPTEAGDHWLVFTHNRGILDWTHSEPQGNQRILTTAKALLDVHGDNETVAFSRLAGHDLEILPLVDAGHLHAGELFRAQLLYFGRPLEGVPVFYYGPDGSAGETITGPGGTMSVPLTQNGNWLITITYFDRDSAGDFAGVKFIGTRYSTTMLLMPHGHGETEPLPPPAAAGNNYLPYIVLIVLLLAGSAFFYGKSTKIQAS